MSRIHRRHFLGAAGAAAAAVVTTSAAEKKDDVVVLGFIGCGGMGNNHLRLLSKRKDVRLAYLCEPDTKRLAASAKIVEDGGQNTPKTIKDMRDIFADKSVDAVFIATP